MHTIDRCIISQQTDGERDTAKQSELVWPVFRSQITWLWIDYSSEEMKRKNNRENQTILNRFFCVSHVTACVFCVFILYSGQVNFKWPQESGQGWLCWTNEWTNWQPRKSRAIVRELTWRNRSFREISLHFFFFSVIIISNQSQAKPSQEKSSQAKQKSTCECVYCSFHLIDLISQSVLCMHRTLRACNIFIMHHVIVWVFCLRRIFNKTCWIAGWVCKHNCSGRYSASTHNHAFFTNACISCFFFWFFSVCFFFPLWFLLRFILCIACFNASFLLSSSTQHSISSHSPNYGLHKRNEKHQCLMLDAWCLMLLHQMTGKFRLKCANVFDFLRSFYAEGGWRTAKCSLRIDGNDNILKNHSFSKPFFSFQCVVQNNWIRIRCQISHRIIDWVNQPNSVLLSWRKVSCSF